MVKCCREQPVAALTIPMTFPDGPMKGFTHGWFTFYTGHVALKAELIPFGLTLNVLFVCSQKPESCWASLWSDAFRVTGSSSRPEQSKLLIVSLMGLPGISGSLLDLLQDSLVLENIGVYLQDCTESD